MAKRKEKYTDLQLAEMYRVYAQWKGWNISPKVVRAHIEAWKSVSIGPMGLAIEYHETGIDGAPHIVDRESRMSDRFSLPMSDSETSTKTTRTVHAKIVNRWHFWAEVAGTSHSNADGSSRRKIIQKCSLGELVLFIREPSNPHDTNAIMVKRESNEQIGYLPSWTAPL